MLQEWITPYLHQYSIWSTFLHTYAPFIIFSLILHMQGILTSETKGNSIAVLHMTKVVEILL